MREKGGAIDNPQTTEERAKWNPNCETKGLISTGFKMAIPTFKTFISEKQAEKEKEVEDEAWTSVRKLAGTTGGLLLIYTSKRSHLLG